MQTRRSRWARSFRCTGISRPAHHRPPEKRSYRSKASRGLDGRLDDFANRFARGRASADVRAGGSFLIRAGGGTGAFAATTVLTAAPTESWQAVYDPKESKIGDIDDVLVDKSGKITGLVIGVGGFLGAGVSSSPLPRSRHPKRTTSGG